MRTIVTIDPGASGGIVIYHEGKATAVKMPKDVYDMENYFRHIRETYSDVIVFVEKVQAFGDDDDEPGKKFAINKMLANYQQLLTIIKLASFDLVEVYPVTWQSVLGFKKIKGETKTDRKRRYKEVAQDLFPEVKVNLNISDALCLVHFAKIKYKYDISWIEQRIQKRKERNLF